VRAFPAITGPDCRRRRYLGPQAGFSTTAERDPGDRRRGTSRPRAEIREGGAKRESRLRGDRRPAWARRHYVLLAGRYSAGFFTPPGCPGPLRLAFRRAAAYAAPHKPSGARDVLAPGPRGTEGRAFGAPGTIASQPAVPSSPRRSFRRSLQKETSYDASTNIARRAVSAMAPLSGAQRGERPRRRSCPPDRRFGAAGCSTRLAARCFNWDSSTES
jgi:hypothetical protein